MSLEPIPMVIGTALAGGWWAYCSYRHISRTGVIFAGSQGRQPLLATGPAVSLAIAGLTAGLWGLAVQQLGTGWTWLVTAVLVWWLVLVGAVDWQTQLVPDRLLLVGLAACWRPSSPVSLRGGTASWDFSCTVVACG